MNALSMTSQSDRSVGLEVHRVAGVSTPPIMSVQAAQMLNSCKFRSTSLHPLVMFLPYLSYSLSAYFAYCKRPQHSPFTAGGDGKRLPQQRRGNAGRRAVAPEPCRGGRPGRLAERPPGISSRGRVTPPPVAGARPQGDCTHNVSSALHALYCRPLTIS